ncbi:hypothetical protein V6N11_075375 [Hibiscus sabdariffa]|uniref:Uncharacterized protein n=1 Tax=Hibiscus sabdariffa TaxID=183260 RepID=A0ABR2R6R0_9ROSI
MVLLEFFPMTFLNWVFLACFICSLLSLESSGQPCDPNDLLALKEFAGNLTEGGLKGKNSTSLARLDRLKRLHLPCNHLMGVLPLELSDLKQLEFLDMSFNCCVDRFLDPFLV